MPTNLYGPNDNFDLEKSHVLPAMIRKIHLAKALLEGNWKVIEEDINKRPIESSITGNNPKEEIIKTLAKYGIFENKVVLWGTGNPMREFLWSEDMADACVFIMERINFKDTFSSENKEIRNTHINIGTGVDISIRALSELIKETIDYQGKIEFDTTKPDGTMKKLTDPSKLHNLGWRHSVSLEEGVKMMYDYYLK